MVLLCAILARRFQLALGRGLSATGFRLSPAAGMAAAECYYLLAPMCT